MLRKRRNLSLDSSTKIKASLVFQIHQENTKQELSNVYLISGSKYHLSCTFYKTSIRLSFSALFGFSVVLHQVSRKRTIYHVYRTELDLHTIVESHVNFRTNKENCNFDSGNPYGQESRDSIIGKVTRL
jgi:hypothetical protein